MSTVARHATKNTTRAASTDTECDRGGEETGKKRRKKHTNKRQETPNTKKTRKRRGHKHAEKNDTHRRRARDEGRTGHQQQSKKNKRSREATRCHQKEGQKSKGRQKERNKKSTKVKSAHARNRPNGRRLGTQITRSQRTTHTPKARATQEPQQRRKKNALGWNKKQEKGRRAHTRKTNQPKRDHRQRLRGRTSKENTQATQRHDRKRAERQDREGGRALKPDNGAISQEPEAAGEKWDKTVVRGQRKGRGKTDTCKGNELAHRQEVNTSIARRGNGANKEAPTRAEPQIEQGPAYNMNRATTKDNTKGSRKKQETNRENLRRGKRAGSAQLGDTNEGRQHRNRENTPVQRKHATQHDKPANAHASNDTTGRNTQREERSTRHNTVHKGYWDWDREKTRTQQHTRKRTASTRTRTRTRTPRGEKIR
ncbi:hypothetical protein, conserved in T.vivax [Trypanosoma vivax Y486]|uniref:Uncharacterized protein n=1 Tax=Trypanosoma vivax (strain Y486) TaxID=1055687 RepID=F9WM38_TRYVY|nr:hypothetical protein, conserved in T.vivax [Trypanosoma vivax Y486]|eukprot:CCD18588.1 hypothetical protein, conserved in T.vivax [Trypanosoma vivax Y486]